MQLPAMGGALFARSPRGGGGMRGSLLACYLRAEAMVLESVLLLCEIQRKGLSGQFHDGTEGGEDCMQETLSSEKSASHSCFLCGVCGVFEEWGASRYVTV